VSSATEYSLATKNNRAFSLTVRILLVSSGSGSRGGGEIFLGYLGKELTERGHDVMVWIPRHPRMDELAEKCARFARVMRGEYLNTYDYPARSLSTCVNWGVSRRLAREWKALKPDVIHINKQNLEDGLDLLRAARLCALPSVCTIHLTQTASYLRARAAWLRDWIARWQLRRYHGVLVAVQERRRETLCHFLANGARTVTIFNGVPRVDAGAVQSLRDAKRRELGLSDSELLVLGVGRLVEQKRPFRFIRLAKDLHKSIPGTKFLWIGDGKLAKEWQIAISNEQLDGVVSCAGWQGEVLPYLLAGDLLLHVAEFEGLPFAIIEAMAAGLPCAVTRELSSEIPFLNEGNVLLVDDIEDLANKSRNRRILARVAEGGYRLVNDKLSVNKMAESYEQLYTAVTQEDQC
jgi:glycosyltransferase involved in cell wall biosynthesis